MISIAVFLMSFRKLKFKKRVRMKQTKRVKSMVGHWVITFMAVLLIATGAIASNFDAIGLSSKEVAKAERLAEKFAVQVDQAEDFFEKNNLSMAGKRFKKAGQYYGKIDDLYKLHPLLLINKQRFDVISKKIAAADAAKNLDKNILSYGKKVNEAKKYLDRRDKKNCSRFLDKSLALYELIPEEHRSRQDVMDSRKLYDEISQKSGLSGKKTTAAPASTAIVNDGQNYGLESKTLKKAKSYAARYDKKLKEAKRFFDEGAPYICQKRLADADKLYVKIGTAYQASPGVVENKKLYGVMNTVITEKISAHKAGIENSIKLSHAGSGFGSDVRDLSRMLSVLIKGKEKKTSQTFLELENFKKGYDSLESFSADCQGKYKTLLEQKPDKKYERISVKEIFHLVENRVKYRDAIIKATSEEALNEIINNLSGINQKILKENTIHTVTLAKLKSADYLAEFNSIGKIKTLYAWIGAQVPADHLKAIQGLKQEQEASIQKVRKKLKFKKSDYSFKTPDMKIAAQKNAKSWGMELVYVGMEADRWHVVKNDLGIPLYKTAAGKGLYKVEGENFYRGYDVSVKKQFNGTGYDPISNVRVKSKITIYKK